MSPEQVVLEYLRQNPFKLPPWEIQNFFADEEKVSEDYLDFSLDKLADFDAKFEDSHKEIIRELQKWALLAVPFFRKIPLVELLSMIKEYTKTAQIFSYLPGFPKAPATKLLDHIFPDNSLTSDEKMLEYEQIAKNTPRVLSHLISWRDSVAHYVDGLENFLVGNMDNLKDEQTERIHQLLAKTKRMIPQINAKIEIKKLDKSGENLEFEQFYRVMSKDQKYSNMDSRLARCQIQVMYDESDRDLRRIVAKMGEAKEKDDNVTEEKNQTRKRTAGTTNGCSADFRRPSCLNHSSGPIINSSEQQFQSSEEIENNTVGKSITPLAKRRKSVRFEF